MWLKYTLTAYFSPSQHWWISTSFSLSAFIRVFQFLYAKTTPTQKNHYNTSVVFSEFFPTSVAFCVLLQGLSIRWLRCNSPAHRRNILKRYIR